MTSCDTGKAVEKWDTHYGIELHDTRNRVLMNDRVGPNSRRLPSRSLGNDLLTFTNIDGISHDNTTLSERMLCPVHKITSIQIVYTKLMSL